MAPVAEVAAHVEMREQARVLEDVTDAAPVRGQVDAARIVEQHAVVDDDAPRARSQQAGDRIEHAGLAGPRRARQCDHARAGFDPHAARETAALEADVDAERHGTRSSPRWRRTSHSDASNAANEIATATAASRQMPASPPGTCISP